ncbi:ADP-ribosylation factor GTPase activating protein, ER-Golgi transport, partial [Haplosporangium sp. Z 27]
MWCNNCCLCFPVRGGGMWLAGLVLLINAIGGILLFLWGPYFFSSTWAVIFGGFSLVQAATAALAFFGMCNWSYMLTRLFVYIEWLIMFIATARIGFMAFQLETNKTLIASECFGAVDDKGYTPEGTTAAFYCNTPIDTFIEIFIIGLVVDYVLNLYLYFVVWRYYVRMRLYPFQKNILNYEEGFLVHIIHPCESKKKKKKQSRMAEPTKQEIQDVFKKLSLHRANKSHTYIGHFGIASTAMQVSTKIVGRVFRLESFFAQTVEQHTVGLAPISTVLDKWTWEQLRTMTVGGNAAAREYFSKQPGIDSKDAKTRYSSKIGTTYKEKLAQKVKEDMLANPGKLSIEDINKSTVSTPATAAASTPSAEDDFFNNWDQPKKATSTTSSPRTIAPPSIGFGATSPTTPTTGSRTSSTAASRPVKSTLTSVRKTGTASKPMKLGAKKAGGISFEEAEARAKAEAERIEKIGFEAAEEERLQKLEAERLREEAAAAAASGRSQNSANNARSNYYQANTADRSRTSSEDLERLGMGMGRMGFGAAPSSKPASTRPGFGSMGNSSNYSPQVE